MKLNSYLNFPGTTEAAFTFYKSVFGGEFLALQRFKDAPDFPGKEKMNEEDLNKVMHVALNIGANTLMGTDALESMGHPLTMGNNLYLSLHPETREEADRLFSALSEGGVVEMPMMEMFWGAYYGSFKDRFGVQWMINCETR